MNHLVKLTMFAVGAALASHAFAQPGDAAGTAALRALESAPRSSTLTTQVAANVAANTRAAMPTAVAKTISATGSVLVLADGIVASAASALIPPPAPGFVYER